MNNEQFKKYAQVKLDIDAYIEKRARRKYASEHETSIDKLEVEEWTVIPFAEQALASVNWKGSGAMIGDYANYYDDIYIKLSISYEDLELTENEFNERYPVCQK